QEKQSKAERARELGKIRQRNFRERQKANKQHDSPEVDANDVLMEGTRIQGSLAVPMEQTDIATVSHAGYEEWREERDGTKKGAMQAKAKRTNWFHPFLWLFIDKAMKKCHWSPADAAKHLQNDHPVLFSRISRQTIGKWKE
ncbi:hypothetical protein L218DRAFT_846629, partial [Marasmius fiardii PR-910]